MLEKDTVRFRDTRFPFSDFSLFADRSIKQVYIICNAFHLLLKCTGGKSIGPQRVILPGICFMSRKADEKNKPSAGGMPEKAYSEKRSEGNRIIYGKPLLG